VGAKINNIDISDKVMFYISHYMKEIEKTCNKVLILDSGKIVAFGLIEDILNNNSGKNIIVEGVCEIKENSYTFIQEEETTKISGFKNFNEACEKLQS
jgi:ABC-type multidrug transport system ATPase subunit